METQPVAPSAFARALVLNVITAAFAGATAMVAAVSLCQPTKVSVLVSRHCLKGHVRVSWTPPRGAFIPSGLGDHVEYAPQPKHQTAGLIASQITLATLGITTLFGIAAFGVDIGFSVRTARHLEDMWSAWHVRLGNANWLALGGVVCVPSIFPVDVIEPRMTASPMVVRVSEHADT